MCHDKLQLHFTVSFLRSTIFFFFDLKYCIIGYGLIVTFQFSAQMHDATVVLFVVVVVLLS